MKIENKNKTKTSKQHKDSAANIASKSGDRAKMARKNFGRLSRFLGAAQAFALSAPPELHPKNEKVCQTFFGEEERSETRAGRRAFLIFINLKKKKNF